VKSVSPGELPEIITITIVIRLLEFNKKDRRCQMLAVPLAPDVTRQVDRLKAEGL
jgi:hypothetical protein